MTVEQLARGAPLLQRVPNPFFGTIPRSSSLGDPTIPVAQLLKPYPRFTTVSLYRNNVGTAIYQGLYARLEQRLSRGLSYLVSYTRSKLMDDASSVFDASIRRYGTEKRRIPPFFRFFVFRSPPAANPCPL